VLRRANETPWRPPGQKRNVNKRKKALLASKAAASAMCKWGVQGAHVGCMLQLRKFAKYERAALRHEQGGSLRTASAIGIVLACINR
jgi:phage tail tape-measure protein